MCILLCSSILSEITVLSILNKVFKRYFCHLCARKIQENRMASENIPFMTFFTTETLRQIKIILLKLCSKYTVYS